MPRETIPAKVQDAIKAFLERHHDDTELQGKLDWLFEETRPYKLDRSEAILMALDVKTEQESARAFAKSKVLKE